MFTSVSKTFCFTVVLRLVVQLECPVVDAEVVGAEEELGGGLDGAQRQGHGDDAKDNSPQKCNGGLKRVWVGDRKKTNSEERGKHSENGGKEGEERSGNYSLSVGGHGEREGEPGERCSHKRVLGRLPWMENIGRSSMGGAFTPLFFPISPENMLLSLQPTPLYLCSLGQVWYKLFLLISNESHNTHRVVRSCVVFCRC